MEGGGYLGDQGRAHRCLSRESKLCLDRKKINKNCTGTRHPSSQKGYFHTTLVKNVKFRNKPNAFQETLKKDTQKIITDPRPLIAADKSSNHYYMESKAYKELVEKEVHKEYKKANKREINKVVEDHKKIVSRLELEDRVFATTQRQCFATLKDHKENFHTNPKVRLINPMKGDVGQISKQILEEVNKHIRKTTKLNQWICSSDPIQWFKRIENKKNKRFIQIDVVNFYPSISENLLKKTP